MKRILIAFSCALAMSASLNSQTIINMPIEQNPLFEVSTNRVDIATISGNVTLGADLVITGGSGTYAYRWYKGGTTLSTEPTLTVAEAGTYMLDIDDTCDCRQTITFNVGAAGIETVTAEMLKVYPNPTKGVVHIDGGNVARVAVVNMYGVLVKVVTPSNARTLTEFDLSDLPVGTYILTLANENGSMINTCKIIRN